MYDGTKTYIYVDGLPEVISDPCGEGVPCGKILYPTSQVYAVYVREKESVHARERE
jgi:hypothetical protein